MAVHRSDVAGPGGAPFANVSIICAREFDDSVRPIVAGLKYHGDRGSARTLASLCVEALTQEEQVDLLAWIPTLEAHRESRGFDHAELIARHVGAMAGMTARRLLRRTSAGHQTGRTRAQRLTGVSFVAHPVVRGRSVCVVDDVCTTGATFGSAAGALVAAGATRVVCVAAAGVTEKFFGRWQTDGDEAGRAHRTEDIG